VQKFSKYLLAYILLILGVAGGLLGMPKVAGFCIAAVSIFILVETWKTSDTDSIDNSRE
jgi:hypothetical protein